ncbi:MAG: UbiA-like polyprenyltransferase, partial [Thermoplasmata archaeon]
RKRDWALVSGRLKVRSAVALTIALIIIFELSSFFLNTFVLMLSPVVLFLFVTDPMLKKYTSWRHIYMGSVIGVGVLAGYLSVVPCFPTSPEIYLLFIASSLWIGGFDMIYVIPDMDYDMKNELKTVMVKYGLKKGLIISDVTHGFAFLFFALLILYFNTYYYAAALIIILYLIVRQHAIVDPERPETIRSSFFNSNSFIGFVFLISVILSIAIPLKIPA